MRKSDADIGDRLWTWREKKTVAEMREQRWHIYTAVCETESRGEAALWAQGAEPSALTTKGVGWGAGWGEGWERRRHTCTCGWFTMFYGRSQHNTVKQLFSNQKQILKLGKMRLFFESKILTGSHLVQGCKSTADSCQCMAKTTTIL